jgi:hypothetical protein
MIKIIARKELGWCALALLLGLAGCATMPQTGGSTGGLPGSMPGGMPGGMPSGSSGGSSGSGTTVTLPGGIVLGGEGGGGTSGGETREDKGSGGAATTADERRGAAEKTLDDSLGEFDKTLEDEQRRTAENRDAQAANRSASAGTSGDAASGGLGRGEGDLKSERTAQAGTGGGDAAGGNQRDRGTVSSGGSGGPDRSRPSGEDDDIVARRLRRAAEPETDPERKEKLWKEYTEYKRNVQGKG